MGRGRYTAERGDWRDAFRPGYATGGATGIIARTTTPAMAQRLRELGVPLVELLGLEADEPAKIHSDNVLRRPHGSRAPHGLRAEELRILHLWRGLVWPCIAMVFKRELQSHGFACDVFRPPRFQLAALAHVVRRHGSRS